MRTFFKKNKKITIAAAVAIVALAPTITLPIVLTKKTELQKNISISPTLPDSNSETDKLGKNFALKTDIGETLWFYNANDAVDFILGNAKYNNEYSGNSVSHQTYIGDIDKSIIDYQNGIISLDNLYKYNKNNVYDAYKTISGSYVPDPYEAARSYLQNYRTLYQDDNGDLHERQSDAIRINKEIAENQMVIGVQYYEIYDKKLNKTFQINPLNYQDIETFKKIAIRNLGDDGFDILQLFGTSDKFVPANAFFNQNLSSLDIVYDLLKIFANAMDKVKYNLDVSLQNSTSTVRSNGYLRVFRTGSDYYGNYYYSHKWEYGDNYQVNANLGYQVYVWDDSKNDYVAQNKISFKNLSYDELQNEANIFINRNAFLGEADIRKNNRKAYFYSGKNLATQYYFEDFNGYTYILNTKNKKVCFKPIVPSKAEGYQYGHVLSLMDASDKNKRISTFNTNISANYDSLNLNTLKKEVKNVIFKSFLKSNNFAQYLIELNNEDASSLINFLDKEITNLASKLVQSFCFSLDNGTNIETDEDFNSITRNIADNFIDIEQNAKANRLNNFKNVWWFKGMNNSKVFETLNQSILNILNALYSKKEVNQNIAITYNNVPVFLVEDLDKKLSINNKSTIINELKKWADGNEYDGNYLVNISSQIRYDSIIKNFSMSKDNFSITEFDTDSPSIIPTLKNSDLFTNSEINKFQHLLLSSLDDPQLFKNDTGIESAINLYNDNIRKITTLPNAEIYINKIDKDTLVDSKNVLRLYKETDFLGDFESNPLPVRYGELKSYTGIFNPSVADKILFTYQSEKEASIKYKDPKEVPIVDINGKSYYLAHIANGPNSAIITGNFEQLVNNATNSIVSKLKPSDDYVFYEDDSTGTLNLIKNNKQTVSTLNLNGKLYKKYWPSGLVNFDVLNFTNYKSLCEYVRILVERKGTYL